ncbi:hypothetical protein NDU88_005134 [Pleurodeles waltl]|uniref:Uncharacterized protein n=1 Tax=Pleurodeles waltl TaxID=8319 RepID=A0AAV7WB05_PLEWA|nr:hypothetical protein NDU88_005134 [Pleurodeles waltl]
MILEGEEKQAQEVGITLKAINSKGRLEPQEKAEEKANKDKGPEKEDVKTTEGERNDCNTSTGRRDEPYDSATSHRGTGPQEESPEPTARHHWPRT